MSDEMALYRALKTARDAHRKATVRRHRMMVAVRLAQAEVLSTHADMLAAEAALRGAQQ
jgi:hypothetical protein